MEDKEKELSKGYGFEEEEEEMDPAWYWDEELENWDEEMEFWSVPWFPDELWG